MFYIAHIPVFISEKIRVSLQKRQNERDGVSNQQPYDCLLNRLFKAQINENIKAPCHWPLWGEFTGDPHKGPVTRKMFPFDDVILMSFHPTNEPRLLFLPPLETE